MTLQPPAPTVHLVAGARPNFMKVAPIIRALQADGQLGWRLVHTGQHFDHNMSGVFFRELGIPEPDTRFDCGGGTHAAQTARVMEAFEGHCRDTRPDAVLVVGDVNSTLACALVARKAGIPVAHVEAGLRSGDMAMPEEINRRATDAICNWFFATEPAGVQHLLREGHAAADIFHVGHVMADNLIHQVQQLQQTPTSALESHDLKTRLGPHYGVVTLHRPANVDDPLALAGMVAALNRIAQELPLAFPVHPRTRLMLERSGLVLAAGVHLLPPQAYRSFLHLWKDAAVVITDSGGLQEETTVLGVPCITARDNTERPVTVDEGSNTLAGTDPAQIVALVMDTLRTGGKRGQRPALWDGQAAVRIVQHLKERMA